MTQSETPVPPMDDGGAVATSVARGFAFLLGSRLVATGLQFASFALLASFLGPRGLGVYTYAISFAALFKLATSFGFRGVVLREVAQRPEREAELLPNLVYLRAALGASAYGLLVGAVVVAGYQQRDREAAMIAGLYLVLLAFESFLIPLEVRLRMGWSAIADIVESVVQVVGILVLGQLDVGVNAYLWLYVVANVCHLLLVTGVAVRMTRFRWRPRLPLWRELVRPAAQLGLAELLIGLYFRIDLLVLARFKPDEDVGQYGAAVRFLVSLNLLQVLALTLLGPVLARSVVEGARILERRYRRAIHLMTVVGLPVAVAGAMTAWRAVPELPGFAEFEGAGRALAILAPAAALMFLGSITSNVIINAHLQRDFLRIAALGLLSVVVLNAALIPGFSYIGAAVATTATEVLVVGCSLSVLHRRLGITWDVRRLNRVVLASAVLAAALVPGYFLHPFLQLALGALAYGIALLPTGAFRWSDLAGMLPTTRPFVEVVVVPGTRPRDIWRAARRADACHVDLREADPWYAPVVVRLAGVPEVTIAGGRWRGWWRWFVDDSTDRAEGTPA